MDLEELRVRARAARSEAERIARILRERAWLPQASEVDRRRANQARLIIDRAAESARSLPHEEVERRVHTLRHWGEGRGAVAVAEAHALLKRGRADDLTTALEAALSSAAADVDIYQREIETWLAEHAMEAWLDAWETIAALSEDEL